MAQDSLVNWMSWWVGSEEKGTAVVCLAFQSPETLSRRCKYWSSLLVAERAAVHVVCVQQMHFQRGGLYMYLTTASYCVHVAHVLKTNANNMNSWGIVVLEIPLVPDFPQIFLVSLTSWFPWILGFLDSLVSFSLVPRPLPDFISQRDKIWEWPGDEARFPWLLGFLDSLVSLTPWFPWLLRSLVLNHIPLVANRFSMVLQIFTFQDVMVSHGIM